MVVARSREEGNDVMDVKVYKCAFIRRISAEDQMYSMVTVVNNGVFIIQNC